jgi:flagellar basal-body rod protein FlgG
MTRGLYIAASGMLNELERQNVIANNLANVDTIGYKRDIALSKAFPSMFLRRINDNLRKLGNRIVDMRPPVGVLGTGVLPDDTAHSFMSGPIRETHNPFDIALIDKFSYGEPTDERYAFFSIQTPLGVQYTRDGSFTLNADGQFVTNDGMLVLGENGPITVPQGEIRLDRQGRLFVDGNLIDKLLIVRINPRVLTKVGNNRFVIVDPNESPLAITENDTLVKSGYLELSNVNVIGEMVDMITAFRAYEANQRAVIAQDDATRIAIGEVGRV